MVLASICFILTRIPLRNMNTMDSLVNAPDIIDILDNPVSVNDKVILTTKTRYGGLRMGTIIRIESIIEPMHKWIDGHSQPTGQHRSSFKLSIKLLDGPTVHRYTRSKLINALADPEPSPLKASEIVIIDKLLV